MNEDDILTLLITNYDFFSSSLNILLFHSIHLALFLILFRHFYQSIIFNRFFLFLFFFGYRNRFKIDTIRISDSFFFIFIRFDSLCSNQVITAFIYLCIPKSWIGLIGKTWFSLIFFLIFFFHIQQYNEGVVVHSFIFFTYLIKFDWWPFRKILGKKDWLSHALILFACVCVCVCIMLTFETIKKTPIFFDWFDYQIKIIIIF